jgi:hypothetical protein
MTTQDPTTMSDRDTSFGLANEGIIKSKAFQFAAAKLKDKAFRCLIKDPDEDNVKTSLGKLYNSMAMFAKDVSTSQPRLGWRLLDQIPTEFDCRSKVITAAHIHGLDKGESRLNQHKVLAIFRPYFFRVGAWNDEIPFEERISKAHVLVEDTFTQFAISSDEDEFPTKRTKRKAKKSKTEENVEVRTKESALQGKAKKGAKKKI